uniref:Uncharacterized protein n=1 Tax=Meleagris gallopavo TaxID=9103 RepID=A0A803XLJ9_MELGA
EKGLSSDVPVGCTERAGGQSAVLAACSWIKRVRNSGFTLLGEGSPGSVWEMLPSSLLGGMDAQWGTARCCRVLHLQETQREGEPTLAAPVGT